MTQTERNVAAAVFGRLAVELIEDRAFAVECNAALAAAQSVPKDPPPTADKPGLHVV